MAKLQNLESNGYVNHTVKASVTMYTGPIVMVGTTLPPAISSNMANLKAFFLRGLFILISKTLALGQRSVIKLEEEGKSSIVVY